MQVLTIDIGTGTQDIYLFRDALSLENGFKLVVPSPTMIIRDRIQAVTQRGEPLLLTGWTMGGGPCHWAARDHLAAGHDLFATPQAARTFNDDLEWVRVEMGVEVVSEDEAAQLKGVNHIELRDFDYKAIDTALLAFGITLQPAAVAVAVFDHGAAPPGVSDRQFRFDYLEERLRADNNLTAFAHLAPNIPSIMTRMHAVAQSAAEIDCPLVVMDTAPAAILGATFDSRVAARSRVVITNIGNFHTLAFRIGPSGVEGVFEHHTGEIDCTRLDDLIVSLSMGTLTHAEVFNDHGHGALFFHHQPLPLTEGDFGVVVTGPRRAMMRNSQLRPHFAVPFGDMMLAGCFGLLEAVANLIPDLTDPIRSAIADADSNTAPWDV
jgi:uncharacterized protein (DUF1786 family)